MSCSHSVSELLRRVLPSHPELAGQVTWEDVLTVAGREGVRVRVRTLSRPGRLVGVMGEWEVQVNGCLDDEDRAFVGIHELVHYWCDRREVSGAYPANPDAEDFANAVAAHLTGRWASFALPQ